MHVITSVTFLAREARDTSGRCRVLEFREIYFFEIFHEIVHDIFTKYEMLMRDQKNKF